jgi:cell wall-associated NlpC family hydrolase
MNQLSAKAIKILLVSALSVCVFAGSAFAAEVSLGVGTVKASSLNLRSSASTSASVLTTLKSGASVVVESSSGGWYKVNYGGTEGYVSDDYISLSKTANASIGTGLVTADGSVNIRSSASTSSSSVGSLAKGAKATIIGMNNGWYKIKTGNVTGYVRSDLMSVSKNSTSSRGSTETAASSYDDSKGSSIVDYAESFLGVGYVYGGSSSSGFDCSGFTMYVMKHFGYSLPHTASGQTGCGTSVAKSDLQPGDLVFFKDPSLSGKYASHAGIYVGNNKFIHASSAGGSVRYSSLSETYYAKYYAGARRLAN